MKRRVYFQWALVLTTISVAILFSSNMQGQDDKEPSVRYALLYEGVDAVRQAIDAGADINELDENGYTPLIWACSYSSKEFYEESAKLLIEKGADINIKANNGTTALIEAAENSREITDLLLKNGASIKDKKDEGTGCFYSCMFGILFFQQENYDLAELMLTKGADVDEAPTSGELQGWTILHFASRENKMKAVKFLLDRGADPNAKNNNGDTPLSMAEKQGNTEVIALLKDHGAK
jgi:ankyrin repeat protein